MKNVFMYAMVGVLLAACSADDIPSPVTEEEYVPLAIEASQISVTRVADDKWETGDAIGVSVINTTSSDFEAINKKYVEASATGDFSPANNDQIAYLKVGTNYDVMAYYPWTNDIITSSDGTQCVKIDLTDQTDLSKIDLLTAKTSIKVGKENNKAQLQFKHALNKISIRLVLSMAYSGEDIQKLKVEICNQNGYALLPINGDKVDNSRNFNSSIQMHRADKWGRKFEAIIHNVQQDKFTLNFDFGNGGRILHCDLNIPKDKNGEGGGLEYTYEIYVDYNQPLTSRAMVENGIEGVPKVKLMGVRALP